MSTTLIPLVGSWYKDLETGTTFEIVALDDAAGTVEIQYFEGEVEELDLEVWEEMTLRSLPPPEDFTGPYDDLERDEVEVDGSARGMDWQNPLDKLD